jgi:hypothetical protein
MKIFKNMQLNIHIFEPFGNLILWENEPPSKQQGSCTTRPFKDKMVVSIGD